MSLSPEFLSVLFLVTSFYFHYYAPPTSCTELFTLPPEDSQKALKQRTLRMMAAIVQTNLTNYRNTASYIDRVHPKWIVLYAFLLTKWAPDVCLLKAFAIFSRVLALKCFIFLRYTSSKTYLRIYRVDTRMDRQSPVDATRSPFW
jgi:hypothetical protein